MTSLAANFAVMVAGKRVELWRVERFMVENLAQDQPKEPVFYLTAICWGWCLGAGQKVRWH